MAQPMAAIVANPMMATPYQNQGGSGDEAGMSGAESDLSFGGMALLWWEYWRNPVGDGESILSSLAVLQSSQKQAGTESSSARRLLF
jgi:c-di-GMP-binding flagellar brake protein YcgR